MATSLPAAGRGPNGRSRHGPLLVAAAVVVAVGIATVAFWTGSNDNGESQDARATSAAVSASSGGQAHLEGVATVIIPSGGVDNDASLRLSAIESPSSLNAITRAAGPGVEIDLSLPLLAPATITLQLDKTLIDQTLPVESIFAAYFDDTLGEWVLVPGTVDPSGESITVTSTHFSWWTPLQANLNRLNDAILAMTSLREPPPACPRHDAVEPNIVWSDGTQKDAIGHCLRESGGEYYLDVSNNRGIPLTVGSDSRSFRAETKVNWLDELVEKQLGQLIIPAGETRTFRLPRSGALTVVIRPSYAAAVPDLIVDALGLIPGTDTAIGIGLCAKEAALILPNIEQLKAEAIIALFRECLPIFLNIALEELAPAIEVAILVSEVAILVGEVSITTAAKFAIDLGEPATAPTEPATFPTTQPPSTTTTQPTSATQPPSTELNPHDAAAWVAGEFVDAWNTGDRTAAQAVSIDWMSGDYTHTFDEMWDTGGGEGLGPIPEYPYVEVDAPCDYDPMAPYPYIMFYNPGNSLQDAFMHCQYYGGIGQFGELELSLVHIDGKWFVWMVDFAWTTY